MEHLLSAFAGLLFVLGLFFLLAWLLKKYGGHMLTGTMRNVSKHEIELLEVRPVDPKNRLVLARCRGKDYLIGVGESGFVVDSYPVLEDDSRKLKEEAHAP